MLITFGSIGRGRSFRQSTAALVRSRRSCFPFIPLFNIYWMFRVIPDFRRPTAEFSKTWNQTVPPKTGFGAGAASCILPFIRASACLPRSRSCPARLRNFAKNRIELLEAQREFRVQFDNATFSRANSTGAAGDFLFDCRW